MTDAFSSAWPDPSGDRDDMADEDRDLPQSAPQGAGATRTAPSRPVPLLLMGDMDNTLDVAKELARASSRELAVRRASAETLEQMRYAMPGMVMVEVPVDIPNVLARLRGEQGPAAPAGGAVDALVGRTAADVERALILGTLTHCQGNRTLASTMLGISVRTMRNKLRSFIEDGIAVSPAH